MANKIQKKKQKFVQVQNSFIRDENISFKAKGLFCYMFSMDNNWNFTIRSIAKQQKDGEASIISAMNELKEYGYIVYTKHQDGSGTYFLDDEPKMEKPNVEKPNVENPNLGKSTRIKKTELIKNTNTKNTKNKQKDLAEEYITIKNVTSESNKEIVKDFVEYRKEISKPLKTIRPIQLFVDELIKLKDLGYSFEHSIKEMKNNEWQTVKVGYIHKPKQQRTYQDKTAGRQRAIKEAFQILEQQQGEVIDYE